MATCRDCIKADVCKYKNEDVSKGTKVKDLITDCQSFKDKSRYIELSCKVGDKVYRPSKYLGVVQFVIISFEMYQSEMFFTDDSENIIYLPDIGKTVFLTREEAEKKLKEFKDD